MSKALGNLRVLTRKHQGSILRNAINSSPQFMEHRVQIMNGDMLYQSAHVETCGLTLSEVEPSLYVKIVVDDRDRVKDWLICKIWTDNVRYFGTDALRKQYEVMTSKRIKVKFLGAPKEFVGTQVIQDLKNGICELKAPKCWEGGALKFDCLFPNGLKRR